MRLFILVVAMLVAVEASAQIQNMYTAKGSATTAWTTIQKSTYQRINAVEILNDAAFTSTDSLFVAFEDDTSSTRRFSLLSQESIWMDAVSLNKIQIRASANTVAYRVRYH